MKLIKEFQENLKKDPKGQYYKHLQNILNVYKIGNTTKKEVLEYVKEWAEK